MLLSGNVFGIRFTNQCLTESNAHTKQLFEKRISNKLFKKKNLFHEILFELNSKSNLIFVLTSGKKNQIFSESDQNHNLFLTLLVTVC